MNRIDKVVYIMNQEEMDYLLICDPTSIQYLLNYKNHPGERLYALLLDKNGTKTLFMNRLFYLEDELEVDIEWYQDTDDSIALIASKIKNESCVGIDKYFPAKFLLPLIDLKSDCSFVNGSLCVDYVRMIKDYDEQLKMQKASSLNDLAMHHVIQSCTTGLNEKEVAEKLLDTYRSLGAQGYSFEPIIAFGKNGANPHHHSSEATLQPGDSIIMDIGCQLDDYCSDMTRTVFYQEVSDEARTVYNLVKNANISAIEYIKPGVKLCDIDKIARDVISEGGYGEYFTHRLGHFIGLDVHEFGDVSSSFDIEVQPGMIFSIEPGIYLPNKLGVRIEDLVLVTHDGCIVLNKYPKDLYIIK